MIPARGVLRAGLALSVPLNVAGAVLFSPPGAALRALAGYPDAPAFYLWMLAAWVLAFGVAYAHAAWTGRADRTLLALGAVGKGVFVLLAAAASARGDLPWTTAASAAPDLVLAALFVRGLVRGSAAAA
jgi:hypothetical protein